MKRTVFDGSEQYHSLLREGWTVILRYTAGLFDLAVLAND